MHLHGNRIGDNAPRALLEVVDSPNNDLKLDLTAMAMGRETFLRATQEGEASIREEIASMGSRPLEEDARLNKLTLVNAAKIIKYRGDDGRALLRQKAKEHFYRLMATREVAGDRRVNTERWNSMGNAAPRGDSQYRQKPMLGLKRKAGMRKDTLYASGPDEPALLLRRNKDGGLKRRNSVIRIGKGAFARRASGRVSRPVALSHISKSSAASPRLARDVPAL